MKNTYVLLTLILTLLFSAYANDSKATHAAGGELIYIHVQDSTYQFFFKFYRDCTGAGAPNQVRLCLYNSCSNQTFSINLPRWAGKLADGRDNGTPIPPGCSPTTYQTKCQNPNSTLPGYEEWWYTGIQQIPLSCSLWRFSVSVNARNPSINIGGGQLYVETTFNSDISWNNSSPFYSIAPIPYVCLGTQYTYNNGALDSDGDSLFSNVIRPFTAQNCSTARGNVNLAPQPGGFPPIAYPNNPIQSNNSFGINNSTGQMQFTAAIQGASTLTVETKEYRNGHEIGSIMRDVQVQVLPCSTTPPVVTVDSVKNGGTIANGIAGCIDQPLEFCFYVKHSLSRGKIILRDNLARSIPGASMTYQYQGTDSARACFAWTPTANDAGKTHSFQVVIKDSTCDPPGIALQYVRNFNVYVWPEIKAVNDTTVCYGEPAFLDVKGGGNYQWSVLSGTDPSLSATNISNPTATPTVNTVYRVVSTVNSYCPNNDDTVEVDVEQGADIKRQADSLTCINSPTPLHVEINRVPGATYTITWTPATGLSNPNIENPIATIKNDITYNVEVVSSIKKCKSHDTVALEVLKGFAIYNPDTAICEGEYVEIRGGGDNRYDFEWESLTSFGTKYDPTPVYSQAQDIMTRITPSTTGTYKYRLTASYSVPGGGKCLYDSTADIDIEVQPNPTVTVNNDVTICYGDTVNLQGMVVPNNYDKYNYVWTPGAAITNPNAISSVFTGTEDGEHNIKLLVNTSAGCSDSDDFKITVYKPDFLHLPADTSICAGDSIEVKMTTEKNPVFYWGPDFNISNINDQQPIVWPIADQKYTVIGRDSSGCLDTNSIAVDVNPAAVIDIPNTVELYAGESYQIDPAGNCLYYSWFPRLGMDRSDISNPILAPKVNTRYQVTARTEAGCIVRDSILVLVKDDSYIDVPNAFAPGSRTNNMLKVLKRGDVKLKQFIVYNRWGVKVFETNNIQDSWDGTLNGEKQPLGVYIYTVEAITPSGRTIKKQGNITLLR